jgi:hypothetical protein
MSFFHDLIHDLSVKRTYSKVLIIAFGLAFTIIELSAQDAVRLRSTTNMAGSSGIINAGNRQYFYQQSVGQRSVTGITQNNKYLLRQGIIQPLPGHYPVVSCESLQTDIFPNPFRTAITISLSETPDAVYFVTIYDPEGRIVWFRKYSGTNRFEPDLSFLAPSSYLIRVNSYKNSFHSRIIKL